MKLPVLIGGVVILLLGLVQYASGTVMLPRLLAGLSSRDIKKKR